ncbi:hypothetical protein [Natronorubrum texcoconense]|nr:hypothetical protein [Natronorubrum texcoconense]
MNRYLLVLTIAFVVLVGGTVAATAQPTNGATAQGEGPPVDLPDPVPDFVTGLLQSVNDFVSGVLSALGEAIQRFVPGAGDAPPSGA